MKLQISVSDATPTPKPQSKVRMSYQTTANDAKIEVDYQALSEALSLDLPTQHERQYNIASRSASAASSAGATTPSIGDSQLHSSSISADARRLLSLFSDRGINMGDAALADSETLFVVESNIDSVLSLAWEQESATSHYDSKVVRRVITGSSGKKAASGSNFLFLLSHGYKDGFRDIGKVANDFQSEVSPVLSSLFQTNLRGIYKPQLFQVVKYLNQGVMSNIAFDSYNNIHLILHGRENGDLGFEMPNDHWQIAWLSSAEFVNQMRTLSNNAKDLIFLSCCYSGYGNGQQPSLAFQLVSSGITKNVIAFNGGVGSERTLPGFVTYFYENYMNSNDIIDAFHRAVGKLKIDRNPYWDKPVLYTRDLT